MRDSRTLADPRPRGLRCLGQLARSVRVAARRFNGTEEKIWVPTANEGRSKLPGARLYAGAALDPRGQTGMLIRRSSPSGEPDWRKPVVYRPRTTPDEGVEIVDATPKIYPPVSRLW